MAETIEAQLLKAEIMAFKNEDFRGIVDLVYAVGMRRQIFEALAKSRITPEESTYLLSIIESPSEVVQS